MCLLGENGLSWGGFGFLVFLGVLFLLLLFELFLIFREGYVL